MSQAGSETLSQAGGRRDRAGTGEEVDSHRWAIVRNRQGAASAQPPRSEDRPRGPGGRIAGPAGFRLSKVRANTEVCPLLAVHPH